jgi:hypothetical protein
MDHIPHWAVGDPGHEFWVNLTSGEVEEGRQSSTVDRMGPYATREAAQHAFDTAARRTQQWDEDDRRWNDDSWPADSGDAAP